LTIQRAITCRFCTRLATGEVSGTGGVTPATGRIYHCDDHWDDAYRIVKNYPSRVWNMIEQPDALF
jgi:hypothetical protein